MIMRVDCPSCGAVLRSTNPKGFTPGTPVSCPKCKQWFAAAPPPPPSQAAPARAAVPHDDPPSGRRKKLRRDEDDDDYDDDYDDDDRPKKKGKKGKKKKDLVSNYTKSPIRAIVIATLIVILGVLSFMLYLKRKRVEEHNRKIDEEINGLVVPDVRYDKPWRV